MWPQRTLWVEDQYASRCRGCDARFNILRRRHHCRNCGQVFCRKCLILSSASVFDNVVADVISSIVSFDSKPLLKFCRVCDRILRQRGLLNSDGIDDLFAANKLLTCFSPEVSKKTFIANEAEEKKITNESLGEFEKNMQRAELLLPPQDDELESFFSSTLRSASHGSQSEPVPTHVESVEEQKISYGLTDTPLFGVNTLSEWLSNLLSQSRKVQPSEFRRISELCSSLHNYTLHPKVSFRASSSPQASWKFANIFLIDNLTDSLQCFEHQVSLHLIKRASRIFAKDSVLSLLSKGNSSVSNNDGNKSDAGKMDGVEWIAGICDMSWRVVSQTAISLKQRVEHHFDVICISGGFFSNSKIITGVAFLQTIAFKRMKTYVESPRILLLGGDVGISTDLRINLLEQIEGNVGYLDKQFQRICIWKPCIIVVEGNMHHSLQKRILCESNTVLILNAGKTIIHRLSRCCNATVICDLQYVSIVDLHNTSILGTCDSFELLHYGDKPISVFNCSRVPLFTTVIFRGAEEHQLDAIKKILLNCVATAYHLCIQAHCMFDLGMLFTKPESSIGSDKTTLSYDIGCDESVKDGDVLSPQGEMRLSGCYECAEYMQLITCSPREEDRIETLSMNFGVDFSGELLNVGDEYDNLITDSIIVNTVSLESVLSGFTGEDAVGGSIAGQTPAHSRHQSCEVLFFYGEGDETLLDYLVGRAKEIDSVRLIVHCNKRVWIKTTTTTEYNDFFTQHINGESKNLLFNYELPDFFFMLNPNVKTKSEGYSFSIWCYSACKNCFNKTAGGVTTTHLSKPCSPHALNISWGAFLEFVIYGAANVNLSCGHSLNSGVYIMFFFIPCTGPIVTVSIFVEPLIIYNIITPPVNMWPCAGSVDKLYLGEETDELQRYLLSVVESIKTLTELQAQPTALPQQQQQPQSQPLLSVQVKSQSKKPFYSVLGLRFSGTVLDVACNVEDEKTKELLRYADEILLRLASLDTMENLIALRLHTFSKLMTEFMEWYKAVVALLERRTGKSMPFPEAVTFEDNNWAFNPKDNCSVRLNEPTSLVASALQSFSFSSTAQLEVVSGGVGNKSQRQQSPGEMVTDNADNNSEPPAFVEAQNSGFHEASIEFMLGIVPDQPQNNHSSPLFIRSSSDAIEILSRKNAVDKTAFKHVMNVLTSWDKTEDITVKVEVMFPEKFAALQYLYTKGRIDDMLLSLSRCRVFKSEGGKTKTNFFVTLDERFLLKQIKQTELKHFAEFASNYFSHLGQMYMECEDNDVNDDLHPQFGGVLAKIFGIFSLHIKRKKRVIEIPGEIRYFVLMENVFFSRTFDVIYDLKGSQRNRIAVEGSSVLLDQDLLTVFRRGDFFYCTNVVQSFLMDKITRDTNLLSNSFIMDYSLIAAINNSSCELYLGVVDYLYPYTGAKVLESKVKAGLETMLGHTGRDPTIIDPVSYRMRFIRWMEVCFCGVPKKTFTVQRFFERKKSIKERSAGKP